jgi:small subunit ribosomal protein S14
MAKVSAVEKNKRRRKLVARDASKRAAELKAITQNQEPDRGTLPCNPEAGRNAAQLVQVRVRNRCEVTGRPRAFYRKLGMSRIALRELGSLAKVPGLVKSSW